MIDSSKNQNLTSNIIDADKINYEIDLIDLLLTEVVNDVDGEISKFIDNLKI